VVLDQQMRKKAAVPRDIDHFWTETGPRKLA